jgi:RNA polymerase sigma factor (sigma-70 family)
MSTDASTTSAFFSLLFDQIRQCGPKVPQALVDQLVNKAYDQARAITRAILNATLGPARTIETDEILHEVLARFVQKSRNGRLDLSHIYKKQEFYNYIAKMIRDMVIDELRKITGMKYTTQHPPRAVPADHAAAAARSFNQEVLEKMAIHELVDHLAPDEIELIDMSFYLEMTHEEIADHLRRELTDEELAARLRRRMNSPRAAAKIDELLRRTMTPEEIAGIRTGAAGAAEIAARLRPGRTDDELAVLVGVDKSSITKRIRDILTDLGQRARAARFEPGS